MSPEAHGQEALPGLEIGAEIVVSPDRVEEPVSRTASSVTVIAPADIEKRGSRGLSDVLRGAPGLDLFETGGPGTATSVYLHGATALAWGAALGAISLLSCETARIAARRSGCVVGCCASFVASFAAYESAISAIGLVTNGDAGDFSPAAVLEVSLVNVCAFAGLWAWSSLVVAIGADRKPASEAAPRYV